MSDKKHRMYADFSDEAYEAYQNGDAVFNNGFRDRKGRYHPDQPEFSELDDNDGENENDGGIDIRLVTLLTAAATGIGYAFARRKDIKHWFTDKVIPTVRNTWLKVTKKSMPVIEKRETATEVSVSDFSSEVDTVLNEYYENNGSEEAQKKLIEIMQLAALLAKKIREFSGTVVNDKDPDYLEMKKAMEKLTTQKTTDSINAILEQNPAFLSESETVSFGELFGFSSKNVYVPIQNDDLRRVLSLKAEE